MRTRWITSIKYDEMNEEMRQTTINTRAHTRYSAYRLCSSVSSFTGFVFCLLWVSFLFFLSSTARHTLCVRGNKRSLILFWTHQPHNCVSSSNGKCSLKIWRRQRLRSFFSTNNENKCKQYWKTSGFNAVIVSHSVRQWKYSGITSWIQNERNDQFQHDIIDWIKVQTRNATKSRTRDDVSYHWFRCSQN